MAYTLSPWSLSDLFPGLDSPELEASFQKLKEHVDGFEKLRPQLTAEMPASSFLEVVQDLEEGTRLANKLDAFASLAFSADTQDQHVQALLGRIRQFMAEMENRTLFFNLWWKDLDDLNATRLLQASGDYRYFLALMRKFKPHTLSEAEEKIVNLKNVTGHKALVTLYDAITNRYVFRVEVDGVMKELTRGELTALVWQSDPGLRARAYQELYRLYGEDGNILGNMYQAIVRDWSNENITLRQFSDPIAVRNLGNDIPDDVVETLLNVARRNSGIFQRFFRLKGRLLGMEKLRRYDIYAPVVKSDKRYEFDKAVEMVMESFSSFLPEFSQLARRVFDENHIDSEIRKGKEDGAFCASVVPGMTPWVELNYQGLASDVATLAHELGHAIHSMLAEKHSVFTFFSSLPLAETASTFAEMMLIDRLLASETDEAVRRDLLFRQMDDAFGTILRQAFFAIFEKKAHEMIQNNASVEELASAYMENLKEQFGDAVELGEEFKWEWVSIPHFYKTPFYVYAYAFGQLLVLALYQQYKIEGDSFKPRYVKILSAGGSEAPEKVCAEAGIDIHSEMFWQGGFNVLSELVDKLEKMG